MASSSVLDTAGPSAAKSHLRPADKAFASPKLDSPRFQLGLWFGTRLLVISIWAMIGRGAQGDVNYYFDHISLLGLMGPAQTMPEYPTPILWVLTVPWLLGFGTSTGFAAAFACLMLALDAAFAYTLWRFAGHRRGQAALFWTLFIAFLGPTVYQRFDLITSVLAGWSLLLLRRDRVGAAGALVGLGAAVKLWPVALWPALCGGQRKAILRAGAGLVAVGGTAALASLVWGGWDRLVSPLSYQSDRGLQVESVFASVPMLLRSLGLGDYAVAISRYQAFEIWGTGVHVWLQAASIAGIMAYGLIAASYIVWFRRGHGRMREAAVLMVFTIAVLIVMNKTFSPQYVIWLGGPLAATITILGGRQPNTPRHAKDGARLRRVIYLVLALTLLTIVVYPIGYQALVIDAVSSPPVRLLVTVVLVARNALVVWLGVELTAWVVEFLKPSAWAQVRGASPVVRQVDALQPSPQEVS